jgi:protein ImuB
VLWIGLHLPRLSLESFEATLPPVEAGEPRPALALLAAHHIVSANDPAHALGVRPGLKRATARALAPRLVLGQADARRDAQALASVAHAALAFTPAVSLSPPQGVLMEVQASLRCFGGHDALRARLMSVLQPLGHCIAWASAPTAQGARLLSQWQDGLHCPGFPELHQALAHVPVALLVSAREHLPALQGMGLHAMGELLRLPRAGLARRFGEALLDELDCAWGRRPAPRDAVVLPATFDSVIELFERADTADQLLHGAGVLLQRLVVWLSARQAFVRRFTLVMKHEPRWRRDGQVPGTTRLDVALADPSRDAAHLHALLGERLARLQLPAPTLALSLQAHDIAHQPPPNADLFPTPRSEHEGLTRLVERLQARLGGGQVQRWRKASDHRPEKSFRCEAAEPGAGGARGPTAARPDRTADGQGPFPATAPQAACHPPAARPFQGRHGAWPVWLLPQAEALREHESQPLLEGRPLRLLSGPERIESGWWDDDGLAGRDYFIAQTAEGALVWVYRTRLLASSPGLGSGPSDGWFLQGRFG